MKFSPIPALRKALKENLRKRGYEVIGARSIGVDPFRDMPLFLGQQRRPVIFDVGANVGQTVEHFKRMLPQSRIHAFEPSPSSFEKLQRNTAALTDVTLNNLALGGRTGTATLFENSTPEMSSILEAGEDCWGEILNTSQVPMGTVDDWCVSHDIGRIEILKSDTQGYDLEVFKGAQQMMREDRIQMLYFEIIFSDMYKDLPGFDTVYRYLSENRFRLVSFYRFHFQNNLASWTDALFINPQFRRGAGGHG